MARVLAASGTGDWVQPRAEPMAVLGGHRRAVEWVGCQTLWDSLEWGVKIVRYDKTEFSEISMEFKGSVEKL